MLKMLLDDVLLMVEFGRFGVLLHLRSPLLKTTTLNHYYTQNSDKPKEKGTKKHSDIFPDKIVEIS